MLILWFEDDYYYVSHKKKLQIYQIVIVSEDLNVFFSIVKKKLPRIVSMLS